VSEPYTPSVEEVRDDYTRNFVYRRAAFDRMIERVRREAAAEQREKDAKIADEMDDPSCDYGPYEVAARIREWQEP
jgi:hypothetical protein